jgi:hypothetical protein
MSENKVMRKAFVYTKEDVTGELRKLQNKMLHKFNSPYLFNDQIMTCDTQGETSDVYNILIVNCKEKDHVRGIHIESRIMLK